MYPSVSHVWGWNFEGMSRGPWGWFVQGGDFTMEPVWMFDVDYVTQNNSMYSC